MPKLFLILFLIILLFKLSFAYAEPHCVDIFNEQNIFKPSLQDQLETLLLDELVIERVDHARKEYFNNRGNEHYAAEYIEVLEFATDLIYKNNTSESEKAALSVGLNKIFDDLSEVSPEFLPTKQLLEENMAVIIANAKYEAPKAFIARQEDNIAFLDMDKLKLNSDYIFARKNVFKLIDSYAQNSMPRDVKVMRIEDLLLADVRYQLLKAFEKEKLINRILDLLEENKTPQPESRIESIEKYLSYGKVRFP